nr:MAG TPA: hypothetical protein [Caudoviricetes sp.]
MGYVVVSHVYSIVFLIKFTLSLNRSHAVLSIV